MHIDNKRLMVISGSLSLVGVIGVARIIYKKGYEKGCIVALEEVREVMEEDYAKRKQSNRIRTSYTSTYRRGDGTNGKDYTKEV